MRANESSVPELIPNELIPIVLVLCDGVAARALVAVADGDPATGVVTAGVTLTGLLVALVVRLPESGGIPGSPGNRIELVV
jgi:hypothetical protein